MKLSPISELPSDDAVWSVAWAPGTSTLASCGSDKIIRVWMKTMNEWECCAALEGVHVRTVRSISWSPCGRYLLSASFDSTVGVWEAPGEEPEWECIATLEGHENEVKCAVFNASATLIATCGRDKSVWIWEADIDGEREFECVSVLHGHTADVKMVAFHPTEDLLFSTSYDGTAKVWIEDMDDWRCAYTMQHDDTIWSLAFSPSARHLCTTSQDGTIAVWAAKENDVEWEKVKSVQAHSRPAYSVQWLGDGTIVSAGGDDNVCFWNSDLEPLGNQDRAHDADINSVASNDRLLATAGDDGIKIWEIIS